VTADKAERELARALEKIGFTNNPRIQAAPLGFGNVAVPCFEHAAANKRKPFDDAKETAEKLAGLKYFGRAEAAGGFVNLYYSDAFYAEALAEMKAGYGANNDGAHATVVVEHSSPNVGKPLHVGHLRCTVYGDALANIIELNGYKVVRSTFLGEAGKQVALLLVALEDAKTKPKDERALLSIYEAGNKQLAEEAFAERVTAKLALMEAGDPETLTELRKVRALSVKPLHAAYERLGVRFDEELFDSDFVDAAKKLAAEAVAKKVARKDVEGETIVDFTKKTAIAPSSGVANQQVCNKEELPNYVLLRSNGTTLYATRDLALADYRFARHAFKECVYVTASAQNLHFQQFFKTLELLGRAYAKRLKHVGYGLVSLPEGKLSTREGRVILVDDLLERATGAAAKEVTERQKYPAALVKEIAGKTGLAAVKFALLRVSPEKNIVFNAEEAVRFEGHTGAFVQYSAVRCKGILEKAGRVAAFKKGEFNEQEKRLIAKLAVYPQVVRKACNSLEIHGLCEYLLLLTDEFNSFYAACPVLKAEGSEKAKRIALVKATLLVLEDGLAALGMETPDKM